MGLQFLSPWALLVLLSLPLLWWLLRATPPAPLRAMFPPLNLLHDLQDDEETPDSAPLWLRLLRLGIATLIILALANPVIAPKNTNTADGPLLLVIDNGWSSAPNWAQMQKQALGLIGASDKRAALVFTATNGAGDSDLRFLSRAEARTALNDQTVWPWTPSRMNAVERIMELQKADGLPGNTRFLWISDGLDHGDARAFMSALTSIGQVTSYVPPTEAGPLLITPPVPTSRGLELTLHRLATDTARTVAVQAIDDGGAIMSRIEVEFAPGAGAANGEIVLPLQLRNRLRFLQVPAQPSAGTSWAFDGGWSRPLVGIVTPGGDVDRQPLLSGFYYLGKALAPHAETIRDGLDSVLKENPSVLILTDPAQPTPDGLEKLDAFVRAGGLLIRFAGPHLAAEADALVPVNLRAGGRLMGGAFGWETPQALAPFSQDSPYYGLAEGKDAAVRRQVLALPDSRLNERIWARLQDGTPLVSSAPRGLGRIVLFHVSAAPDWSDLPLSGLFADMLERTLAFAKSDKDVPQIAQSGRWELEYALNAIGKLQEPKGGAAFLPVDADFTVLDLTADHPPGIYRNGPFTRALNIGSQKDVIKALPLPPSGMTIVSGNATTQYALKAALLLLSLFLLGVDMIAALWLAGRLRGLQKWLVRQNTIPLVLLVALLAASMLVAPSAMAQDAFTKAIKAAQSTRLAYIITGDLRVDEMSRAGLYGLSQTLIQRTTVEPGAPVGVKPDVDDLSVFSLIYWPVLRPPILSSRAIAELDVYLKNGGMLVIDTQDGGLRAKAAGGIDPALGAIFSQISVPSLRPIDRDHVLTRTYYLIIDFPGRTTGGRVWVESDANGSSLDGVSGIVAGSDDWVAAWALDQNGQPIAALSDEIPRQREMARRFGINLVMYALTGNYKADQVHIPALLERLGEK